MFGFENYGNNDTRSGFGVGLVEAASKNKDIVALCADLTGSLKMNDFKKNALKLLKDFPQNDSNNSIKILLDYIIERKY
mgnify:CR=1 FL=1